MNKSYATNFAIETGNDHFLFITPHSFDHKFTDSPDDIIEKCHIYCVVDFPRINFIPDSLEYKAIGNELIYRVLLEYRYQGEIKRVGIEDRITNFSNISKITIDKYPYIDIVFWDSNDNFIMSATAIKIAYAFNIKDLTDLKVLYIGKSTGIKKTKNALDRAKEHSTIQKILANHNIKHPDRSLLVGLFNFGTVKKYALVDGIDQTKVFGLEDFNRLKKAQHFYLPLDTKTAIIRPLAKVKITSI